MLIRIIVRYCLPWGNFSTQAIEINSESDAIELYHKIQEKFHILPHKQIIKFKRDGFTIRIIPGWKINFYEINDKSILYLEKLENNTDKYDNNIVDVYKMQGRYYAKLGILATVNDDEDEGEEDEKPPRKFTLNRDNNGNQSPDGIFDGINTENRSRKSSNISDSKFKEDIERLISETKKGNLKNIKAILETINTIPNSHEMGNTKIKKLIEEKNSSGWNSLHFAVFTGNQSVLKEFLEKNVDVNIQTNDGWTPLQLAIHKNQYQIAQLLLKSPQLKIDYITSRGAALHLAAKTEKLDFVQLLIENKADIYLKNNEGEMPSELTNSQEIQEIIKKAAINHLDWYGNSKVFKPPKPPIVKGWMFKKSGPFQLSIQKRYFILNPDEGTFIRYKRVEDCPNKPIEVIPLKDILNVKRISQGWLDKREYHYLELQYTSRFVFATKSENAINQWVKFIYQGIAYAIYIEEELKDPMISLSKNDHHNELNIDKNQVLEIIDNIDEQTNMRPKLIKQENNFNLISTSSGGEKTPEGNSPSSKKSYNDTINSIKNEEIVMNINGYQSKNMKLKGKDMNDFNDIINDEVNFKSFDILRVLGSGAFGKVYKVRKRDTGKIYALKALNKRQLMMKNQLRYAITECNVLKNANHPFVLGLHYTFQTPNFLYFVLDYCPGGDLSLHLAQRATFTEEEARFYIAELILAIEHLHTMNVIYRDLKPENILIAEDGHIKLADFGLAKEGIQDDATTNSFCGSPAYLSPEMLKNKSVGKAADLYGIGTVLYEMLVGQSPFYCDDIPKMYGYIQRGKLTFPRGISETAKAFILKLLNRNPNERVGVKDKNELRNDSFFKGMDWKKVLKKEYTPPIIDDIDDFDDKKLPSKIILQDTDYDEKNQKYNRISNYTFVRSKPQNHHDFQFCYKTIKMKKNEKMKYQQEKMDEK